MCKDVSATIKRGRPFIFAERVALLACHTSCVPRMSTHAATNLPLSSYDLTFSLREGFDDFVESGASRQGAHVAHAFFVGGRNVSLSKNLATNNVLRFGGWMDATEH